MAHPNEDLFRKGYEAFGKGDLDTVRGLLADDVVWHVGGRSQLAGDYKGADETLQLFGRFLELSGGTFRTEVHDVLANDEHGVALVSTHAERQGRTLSARGAHVVHIRGGKVAESWLHPDDQYAVDEFWS